MILLEVSKDVYIMVLITVAMVVVVMQSLWGGVVGIVLGYPTPDAMVEGIMVIMTMRVMMME